MMNVILLKMIILEHSKHVIKNHLLQTTVFLQKIIVIHLKLLQMNNLILL
jgi:hypothetical protein